MEILNFKGSLSDLIYILKKGGSIHIKKKNRGKFTESAKRAGMGVQEYARHILANKDKYSSTLVKRANFARNAKKFKHEDGGIIKYQNPSMVLPEIVTSQTKKIWNSEPVKKVRNVVTEVNDRLNGDKDLFTGEPTKYGKYGEYPINQEVGAIGLLAGPRHLPKLSFYGRPTFSQMRAKDIAAFAERSGLEKLSSNTYRELKALIVNAQNGKTSGSNMQRVAKMIDDDIRAYSKLHGKPLNRWQQPFDEMIPMENFGHRRKTTDNFKLSDHYEDGGVLKAQEGIENTIKSAEAVVKHPNTGEITPISKRDNFNIPSILMGATPLFLGLGAAKTVSNHSNIKEQQ